MGSRVVARRRLIQGSVALAGLGVLAGCGLPLPGAPTARKTPRVGLLSILGADAVRARVAALARQHRLPAMYATREFVDAGGLMVYEANVADLYRRTATYVDKILKGSKPADLPVEQAAKFDFVISLAAGRAIGLTVPASVLPQATEVIQ